MKASARMRNLMMVAASLVGAAVVYVVVIFVLLPYDEDPSPSSGTVTLVMIAAAAMLSIALPFVRWRLLGGLGIGRPDEGAVSRATPMDEAVVREDLPRVIARYYTVTIAGMAMGEGVIVCGVVAAFAANQPTLVLPFFAVGLAAMVIQLPRPTAVLSLLSPEAVRAILDADLEI